MESNKDKKKVWGILLVVFLISFFCFAPDLRNEFVLTWDDDAYIANNPYIRTFSLETIRWAFFDYYNNYWAPITWISFALDYAVWGLDPVGYHLTNNLFHSTNAALFFLLSLELIKWHRGVRKYGDARPGVPFNNSAYYPALLSSLIFAIHPLRVESVAWATERKDVLSLFFGIPAVLAYLKHAQASRMPVRSGRLSFQSSPYFYAAILLHCLSLLCKATLVTLPVIFLVLDWYPLNRLTKHNLRELLLEKIPFLFSSAVASLIISSALSDFEIPYAGTDMLSRVLIAFRSIMEYLRFTVWPLHLSPFHLHPLTVTPMSIEYIVPVLFFSMVTISCAFLVKRYPALMASWLVYLIALAPVLGLKPFSHTAMADRLTYFPGMAIAILAGNGIATLTAKYSDSGPARMTISGLTILLISSLCFLTVRQISYWKDDVTLWNRAIDLQPHFSGRMYFQRSLAHKLRGDFPNALADINEALSIAQRKHFRHLDTIYAERARILKAAGDFIGATDDYGKAIAVSENAHWRGVYHFERGNIYKEMGLDDLADADFALSTMSDTEK